MYFLPIAFASPEFDEYVKIRYTEILEPLDLDFDESAMDTEKYFLNYGLFNRDFQLLGGIQLDINNARLDNFSVSRAYQKRGYGKTILDNIKKVALEHGLTALSLECPVNLSAFFAKSGFEINEKQFESGSELPLIQMKVTLI